MRKGKAMAARPLSEVYAGQLSRDWAKLLDALEAGETRVIVHTKQVDEFTYQAVSECKCMIYEDRVVAYDFPFGGCFKRADALKAIDKNAIGFFPTNDEEK